jgi:RHS repeat-associated protein
MAMAYDGKGRRISKTRWVKARGDAGWQRRHVTHYTGIGTEVRENFAGESPETKVVVNMPQGLGRYGIENADHVTENGSAQTFEWYLKNHLGSTMLVYGTGAGTPGGLKAAYDYRSFGEQIELTSPSTGKVTENFTGKERDDETQLDYFGARYLDPMLGMWTSVDPKRQFASPYLYAGNEANSINGVDPDGNGWASAVASAPSAFYNLYLAESNAASRGESYFGMVHAGLIAFFTTLGAGALMGPTSTAGQMAFGAASAALVETADQAIAQEKLPSEWDVDEIAHQARNGAILGLIGGLSGDAALSVLNLSGEASGVISGTVGTLETMLFTTGVEKGYIQDEWNSCSDK